MTAEEIREKIIEELNSDLESDFIDLKEWDMILKRLNIIRGLI